MVDRSNWDPEMAAFTAAGEEEAKAYPPIRLEIPLEPHRRTNDALSMRTAEGGPTVAETTDRWVAARGRRIYCRVYRPRTDKPLPVLVWFHGGGWVWASVDTHDRLCREYAAAAGIAVVSVDYALSPEAKFPQAVEECAAVVRHIAEHGADWGLDGSRILLGGDSAGGNLCLATALLLRDSGGPKLRRDRRVLSGMRQPVRYADVSGVRRRRLRPEPAAHGVLLERLCVARGRPLASAGGGVACRPARPAAGVGAPGGTRRAALRR